jgi:mono/diheme cytochrome c family protein
MAPRRRRAAGVLVALGVLASACGKNVREPGSSPEPGASADGPRGQLVYETRCAPCHGAGGGGDGPAAAALDPKPRNFHDPAFWKGRTREQLRLVVEQGRPGTLMAPFAGVLAPAEIDDVVAYLEGFRPAGS